MDNARQLAPDSFARNFLKARHRAGFFVSSCSADLPPFRAVLFCPPAWCWRASYFGTPRRRPCAEKDIAAPAWARSGENRATPGLDPSRAAKNQVTQETLSTCTTDMPTSGRAMHAHGGAARDATIRREGNTVQVPCDAFPSWEGAGRTDHGFTLLFKHSYEYTNTRTIQTNVGIVKNRPAAPVRRRRSS